MSTALERLGERGLTLPPVPAPAAVYRPWARVGDLVFTAGQVPIQEGRLAAEGLVGGDVTLEQAQQLAEVSALNVLAIANEAFNGLDDVRVVKLTVFVASAAGFTDQHLVANGASELLGHVLGESGSHARSAVGVPALPLNSPVEVEAVLAYA